MMNKELIKKRFSKCITTYDENAKIQKRMAEKLFSLLERSNFDKILEIGCGTGLLTKIAIDKLNFKSYTANDIVEDCKDLIKKLSPEIKFVQADIENAIKDSNNKYDLIIRDSVKIKTGSDIKIKLRFASKEEASENKKDPLEELIEIGMQDQITFNIE